MRNIFIAIASVIIIAGCKKEGSNLTDVSANGEYFNCYINGKYWTYKQCGSCLFGSSDALDSHQEYNVPYIITRNVIEASNVEGFPHTIIVINIDQKDFLAGDTIMLGKNPSRLNSDSGLNYAVIYGPNGLTDSMHTGRLIFTRRTDKWQEGTFYFNAGNDGGEIVSVTNGRFAIALD